MRKELYEENWEIQLLRRELEQAEAWLAAKESFLSDPSYGVSNNSGTLLTCLLAYTECLGPEVNHSLNSNAPLRLQRAGALSPCRSEPGRVAAFYMVMSSRRQWLPRGGRKLGKIPDHFFT